MCHCRCLIVDDSLFHFLGMFFLEGFACCRWIVFYLFSLLAFVNVFCTAFDGRYGMNGSKLQSRLQLCCKPLFFGKMWKNACTEIVVVMSLLRPLKLLYCGCNLKPWCNVLASCRWHMFCLLDDFLFDFHAKIGYLMVSSYVALKLHIEGVSDVRHRHI